MGNEEIVASRCTCMKVDVSAFSLRLWSNKATGDETVYNSFRIFDNVVRSIFRTMVAYRHTGLRMMKGSFLHPENKSYYIGRYNHNYHCSCRLVVA